MGRVSPAGARPGQSRRRAGWRRAGGGPGGKPGRSPGPPAACCPGPLAPRAPRDSGRALPIASAASQSVCVF